MMRSRLKSSIGGTHVRSMMLRPSFSCVSIMVRLNRWRITANGKLMGKAAPLRELLTMAYNTSESRLRMLISAPWPSQRFDSVVSLPSEQKEGLQQAIRKTRLTGNGASLEDVYVLSARTGDFPGLQPTVRRGGAHFHEQQRWPVDCNNATINALVRTINS